MSINEIIPVANFPEKSGKYKLAQMIIDNSYYLRFSDIPAGEIGISSIYFTNDIIKETAKLLGREYPKVLSKSEKFRNVEIPSPISSWYSLIGDGFAKINVERKEIEYFFGKSCIYNLGINEEFNENIKGLVYPWKLP